MESLHYLLMKAHSRMQRRVCTRAAALGLTSGQPKVLEYLFQHGESNQKSIAEYCEIEQATVGSILARMELSGLIVRSQHEGNRRSLYAALTAEGRLAAEQMADVFDEVEAQACATLTPEEKVQLRCLLNRFCGSTVEQGATL